MDRSKGIGGTDIGCIIGVNPWKSAMDLYLEKVGITENQPDNDAMWFGREMEPVLRKRYVKETGNALALSWTSPIVHPDYPWYLGSPDDIVASDKGGVDFKTTGRRSDYGEPGSDEVPPWVATQAHWYMGLTGAQWWDIAVLFFAPRREFHIFRLTRNQEIIDNLTEAGREFWEKHVVPQVPPPLDASEGTKKLLAHLYPRDVEDVFAATAEIEELAERIKHFEFARDISVQELVLCQNRLKDLIGNHSGVITSLGRVTWRRSKDTQVVDWKAAFDYLSREMTEMDRERIVQKHTTTRPGSRRFVTKWNKEEA